jgi:hypothetical protein
MAHRHYLLDPLLLVIMGVMQVVVTHATGRSTYTIITSVPKGLLNYCGFGVYIPVSCNLVWSCKPFVATREGARIRSVSSMRPHMLREIR